MLKSWAENEKSLNFLYFYRLSTTSTASCVTQGFRTPCFFNVAQERILQCVILIIVRKHHILSTFISRQCARRLSPRSQFNSPATSRQNNRSSNQNVVGQTLFFSKYACVIHSKYHLMRTVCTGMIPKHHLSLGMMMVEFTKVFLLSEILRSFCARNPIK